MSANKRFNKKNHVHPVQCESIFGHLVFLIKPSERKDVMRKGKTKRFTCGFHVHLKKKVKSGHITADFTKQWIPSYDMTVCSPYTNFHGTIMK